MLSSEVRVEEEEVLESDACCFLDGWSEMVELWVAVAQLEEEHVSNNHRNLMIS